MLYFFAHSSETMPTPSSIPWESWYDSASFSRFETHGRFRIGDVRVSAMRVTVPSRDGTGVQSCRHIKYSEKAGETNSGTVPGSPESHRFRPGMFLLWSSYAMGKSMVSYKDIKVFPFCGVLVRSVFYYTFVYERSNFSVKCTFIPFRHNNSILAAGKAPRFPVLRKTEPCYLPQKGRTHQITGPLTAERFALPSVSSEKGKRSKFDILL